jgi:two-component system cell cycle response regulator DivK
MLVMGIHCEWRHLAAKFVDAPIHFDSFVLMDIRLPREDGYGALRKVALAHLKDTLVVAVTGLARSNCASGSLRRFPGQTVDPDRFTDQIRNI